MPSLLLSCPCAACKWQGALNDVMDHLKKKHKSITTLQEEEEKLDHGQHVFYAVVQLIGAKEEADNFMYRMAVYDPFRSQLIDLVELEPCLWDPLCSEYRLIDRKNNAWSRIAKILEESGYTCSGCMLHGILGVVYTI
ncbi:hypothetical protein GCK32_007074 [Trichostrongylus colubriformis]|uniref:MADF domain-containing protein n=1 Tax=Trichostrongylus colubriformis TaxID=6319 RepID=A0AAN8IE06_TRICO